MQVSDQDWELLNAFADGELPSADSRSIEERAKTDPALAEAFESIQTVAHALSALKPDTNNSVSTANDNHRRWVWLSGAAVAAALVLVVFLDGSVALRSPADIHAEYVAQNYTVEALAGLRQISGSMMDGFPDLANANLTLAVTRKEKTMASAHYVGQNGCRLTVLKGNGEPPTAPRNIQSLQWTAGSEWYQAVATSMAQARFDAVTDYLKQVTQERVSPPTVLALQGTVRTAAPCAYG